jgi:hypothetical protein
MSWSFLFDREIVLSLLTPLAVALLIFILEKRGPLAAANHKTTGLVGPYFTSVAILFGLFAALLMTDVWRKESAAWQSVQAEDDALRAIVQLARVNDFEGELVPEIKAYVAAASRENPYSNATPTARDDTDRAYEALLRQAIHVPGLDGPTRTSLLATFGELRRERDHRLLLADDETVSIKWVSILVLGALTQIAILLVHIGNRRAIRVSVGLFTVAFTFCLVMVAVFDSPFDALLADEPGRTLSQTIADL